MEFSQNELRRSRLMELRRYTKSLSFFSNRSETFLKSERQDFEQDIERHARLLGLSRDDALKEKIDARAFFSVDVVDEVSSAWEGEIDDDEVEIDRYIRSVSRAASRRAVSRRRSPLSRSDDSSEPSSEPVRPAKRRKSTRAVSEHFGSAKSPKKVKISRVDGESATSDASSSAELSFEARKEYYDKLQTLAGVALGASEAPVEDIGVRDFACASGKDKLAYSAEARNGKAKAKSTPPPNTTPPSQMRPPTNNDGRNDDSIDEPQRKSSVPNSKSGRSPSTLAEPDASKDHEKKKSRKRRSEGKVEDNEGEKVKKTKKKKKNKKKNNDGSAQEAEVSDYHSSLQTPKDVKRNPRRESQSVLTPRKQGQELSGADSNQDSLGNQISSLADVSPRRPFANHLDGQPGSTKASSPLAAKSSTVPFVTSPNIPAAPSAQPRPKSTPTTSRLFNTEKTIKRSRLDFPDLGASHFGLIQERLWNMPFHLLSATIFLTKTKGEAVIPLIMSFCTVFKTPEELAEVTPESIEPFLRQIGLQNSRSGHLVALAKAWVQNPPTKGIASFRKGYPKNRTATENSSSAVPGDDNDPEAFEVAHLLSIGPYAIDSWRIFCRDALLESACGSEKTPASTKEHIQQELLQEWTRVLPEDKELRRYLQWRWLRLGWLWDPLTGKRELVDFSVIKKMEAGEIDQYHGYPNPWMYQVGESAGEKEDGEEEQTLRGSEIDSELLERSDKSVVQDKRPDIRSPTAKRTLDSPLPKTSMNTAPPWLNKIGTQPQRSRLPIDLTALSDSESEDAVVDTVPEWEKLASVVASRGFTPPTAQSRQEAIDESLRLIAGPKFSKSGQSGLAPRQQGQQCRWGSCRYVAHSRIGLRSHISSDHTGPALNSAGKARPRSKCGWADCEYKTSSGTQLMRDMTLMQHVDTHL